MATAEFVEFEPSGRSILESNENTDLDLILEDFAVKETIVSPDVGLFGFATRFYGATWGLLVSQRRVDEIARTLMQAVGVVREEALPRVRWRLIWR